MSNCDDKFLSWFHIKAGLKLHRRPLLEFSRQGPVSFRNQNHSQGSDRYELQEQEKFPVVG